MKNPRTPISFIATDRSDEALAFYSDVLGLELREASHFALVFADGDQTLRVQIVSEFEPVSYTVHGWQVASITDEIEKLISKGVIFQRFDQLSQDELGIWTTPDGHKIAWFTDPSGNTLSLTQFQAT
ncbi:MAG: VOC family protein [Paracoccaceae bacterium]